ncbi:PPE domain-containing protein [Nocardia sp. NPDC058705]|uniref:PPE domain-containing protein n=1 Tax=Nocardia sp. NPDC058705 TaxID=3346609 RepID=UPI003675DC7C
MAESGVAWARLAAGFAAAVVDYEQILGTLRGAWQSTNSRDVIDRITALRDWLTEAAAEAAANAARAETQAAAFEIARLAMPNAAEIAAIAQVQKMLAQVGGALGAPVAAIAAQTEDEADVAKATASRVMRAYEAATEPLATPWQQTTPPVLATDAALVAERSGSQPSSAGATPSMPVMVGGLPAGLAGLSVAREKTEYRTQILIPTDAPEIVETVAPQPVHTVPAGAMPMMPGAMGAGAATAEDEEYQSRAGDAGTDVIGADLGIVSAPAVLGVPERIAGTGQSAGSSA